MNKPEIISGIWSYSEQKGTPGHCMMAQVFDGTKDELSICSIRPLINPRISTNTAIAISAVPELIDALIEAYRQMNACNIVLEDDYNEIERREITSSIKSIKQALLKAGCTETK